MGDSLLKDQPKSDPAWLQEKREQLQADLSSFKGAPNHLVTVQVEPALHQLILQRGPRAVMNAAQEKFDEQAKWTQAIPDDLRHWVENMGAAWVNDTLGEKATQERDERRKEKMVEKIRQVAGWDTSTQVTTTPVDPIQQAHILETEARIRHMDAQTDLIKAKVQRILMKNRRNEQRTP